MTFTLMASNGLHLNTTLRWQILYLWCTWWSGVFFFFFFMICWQRLVLTRKHCWVPPVTYHFVFQESCWMTSAYITQSWRVLTKQKSVSLKPWAAALEWVSASGRGRCCFRTQGRSTMQWTSTRRHSSITLRQPTCTVRCGVLENLWGRGVGTTLTCRFPCFDCSDVPLNWPALQLILLFAI